MLDMSNNELYSVMVKTFSLEAETIKEKRHD